MKTLLGWPRRFRAWLSEAELMWLGLLTLVFAGVLALNPMRPGWEESQVRLGGLVLQWLGLLTVALGIRQTRRLFNRPLYTDLLRVWLSRFPRWRQHYVLEAAAGSFALSGGSARLSVWASAGRDATIEKRVEVLERNVEHLRKDLSDTETEFLATLRANSDTLLQERQARAAEDSSLRRQLETAAAGGLHLSVVGLVWLFAGVLLSTASQEIARWVQ